MDAGMPGFSDYISEVGKKANPSAKPKAIVLTHAYFDHIDSLEGLLKMWVIPM
ncbi:hypothetical protein ABHN11_32005 [Brevibacillus centrosporus]|uniref:hypothetical protein n=1 Tax=Brevibacillus centrosporus TaxID=54910 RepID=UPI003D1E70FC